MEVWLYFGQHRDVQVIREEIKSLNGVVIPAHIIAYQQPSTAAFVSSLPTDTPYLIDPATYRFQNSGDKHINTAGNLRPSTQKLCDAYHPMLADLVRIHGRLNPDILPKAGELTDGILRFQREAVVKGSSQGSAAKYLARYEKLDLKDPRALVPPYFRFDSPGDQWYTYSLDCAKAALAANTDFQIAPIIAAPVEAFIEAHLLRILHDYSRLDNVIL